MMMKIKLGRGNNWRVIDNVKSFTYQYMNRNEAEKLKYDDGSLIPRCWIELYKSSEDESNKKRMAYIVITFANRESEIVLTDTVVYVLNNEGKTCESIGVFN
jgi:hypothetical protein